MWRSANLCGTFSQASTSRSWPSTWFTAHWQMPSSGSSSASSAWLDSFALSFHCVGRFSSTGPTRSTRLIKNPAQSCYLLGQAQELWSKKSWRRLRRMSPPKNGNFTSRDGLRLQWYSEGSGPKQILICNGVNCSYLLWKPLLDSLSDSFGKDWREQLTVVTWDYRGLYKSEASAATASYSVRTLCEDAYDLMQHMKLEKWDAVCGWSTGVQCALEYAGLYPETVDRLFLVNGSHGHTLHTAFQPVPQFFYLSLMSRILSSAIYFVTFQCLHRCQGVSEIQGSLGEIDWTDFTHHSAPEWLLAGFCQPRIHHGVQRLGSHRPWAAALQQRDANTTGLGQPFLSVHIARVEGSGLGGLWSPGCHDTSLQPVRDRWFGSQGQVGVHCSWDPPLYPWGSSIGQQGDCGFFSGWSKEIGELGRSGPGLLAHWMVFDLSLSHVQQLVFHTPSAAVSYWSLLLSIWFHAFSDAFSSYVQLKIVKAWNRLFPGSFLPWCFVAYSTPACAVKRLVEPLHKFSLPVQLCIPSFVCAY